MLILCALWLQPGVGAEVRSIHIDCDRDSAGADTIALAASRHPDLLVLEHCSPQDIEFWLQVLEKKFSRLYTLWLKAVKLRSPPLQPWGGGERRPCSRIHQGLEKLKISGTEFGPGFQGVLDPLLACSTSLHSLELSDNLQGYFSAIPAESILRLNASHSQLAELPEGMFSALRQVEDLDLSANRLVKIPNGVFRYTILT